MKLQAILLFAVCLLITTTARGQTIEGDGTNLVPIDPQITGSVTLTPDMWLYLHEQQRQDDPQLIVRRKAEWKAAARRNRIAARSWFGYSAARPRTNPTPWTSEYSAVWVGNGPNPLQWLGAGNPIVAVQPGEAETRR